MYLPYLRGKQFEFLALRELAARFGEAEKSTVIPIVEPVKSAVRDALSTFKSMMDKKWKFALILNPKLGDFERGGVEFFPLVSDLLDTNREAWIPAFVLGGDFNVQEYIERNNFRYVMVILPKNEDVEKWQEFLSKDYVESIVVCNADSSSVFKKVKRLQKHIIRLDDCFQSELRNADFAGKEDQFFNDNHSVYMEDDWWGFADYTTLPSKMIDGGVSPTVVAIHFTYKRNEDEIWIHHFLSDTSARGNENVQGKFYEAASQVKAFFEVHTESISQSVDEMVSFVESGHYPGLGTIKKVSMMHHITLMSRF